MQYVKPIDSKESKFRKNKRIYRNAIKMLGERRPRCPAVLYSGHQCIYKFKHKGYHKATNYDPYGGLGACTSEYCWEDPKCGVHNAGWR